VEVARHLGNLSANRVATGLVSVNMATAGEITVGRMAGMATGWSAAAGSFGAVPSGIRGNGIANAEGVRRGSYTVIFQRLRSKLADPKNQAITEKAGVGQMNLLAQAFDAWLNTALSSVGTPLNDQDARRKGDQLAEQMQRFLEVSRR
jgi:hypothetical protein